MTPDPPQRSTTPPTEAELDFAATIAKGSPHSLALGCTCGTCNYPLDSQTLYEHPPSGTLMATCPECGRATVCAPMHGRTLGRDRAQPTAWWAALAWIITGMILGPIALITLLVLISIIV